MAMSWETTAAFEVCSVQAGISLLKSNVSSKCIAMWQMFIFLQESSGHSDQAWKEMSHSKRMLLTAHQRWQGFPVPGSELELCVLVSRAFRAGCVPWKCQGQPAVYSSSYRTGKNLELRLEVERRIFKDQDTVQYPDWVQSRFGHVFVEVECSLTFYEASTVHF